MEVRTINSRYFKLTVRSGEGYAALEPQIDALVRQHIKRGTVQVSLRVDAAEPADAYQINAEVLAGYRRAARTDLAPMEIGRAGSTRRRCCSLPGVVIDNELAWPMPKPIGR